MTTDWKMFSTRTKVVVTLVLALKYTKRTTQVIPLWFRTNYLSRKWSRFELCDRARVFERW